MVCRPYTCVSCLIKIWKVVHYNTSSWTFLAWLRNVLLNWNHKTYHCHHTTPTIGSFCEPFYSNLHLHIMCHMYLFWNFPAIFGTQNLIQYSAVINTICDIMKYCWLLLWIPLKYINCVIKYLVFDKWWRGMVIKSTLIDFSEAYDVVRRSSVYYQECRFLECYAMWLL
jgi:hypothetical protein